MRPITLAGTASTTRSASSSSSPVLTRAPSARHSMRSTGLESRTASPSSAASASATRWLPRATLGEASLEWAARPARVEASTRSAVAAHDTSSRARIASARRAVERKPVEQLGRRDPVEAPGAGRRLDLRQRGLQSGTVGAGTATRLALAVAHALVPQPEPEALDVGADGVVAGEDELRPELDHGAVLELPGPHPPSDAVARLQHDDLEAVPGEGLAGREAREAGSDDDDPHGARQASVRARSNASRSASTSGRERPVAGSRATSDGLRLGRELAVARPDLLAQPHARATDVLDGAADDHLVVVLGQLAPEVDRHAREHVVPGVADAGEQSLDQLVAAFLQIRRVDRVVDVAVGVDVAPADLDALLVHGWRRS